MIKSKAYLPAAEQRILHDVDKFLNQHYPKDVSDSSMRQDFVNVLQGEIIKKYNAYLGKEEIKDHKFHDNHFKVLGLKAAKRMIYGFPSDIVMEIGVTPDQLFYQSMAEKSTTQRKKLCLVNTTTNISEGEEEEEEFICTIKK